MNYIKKCIVSKLENEPYSGTLFDIGKSIGEVIALLTDENNSEDEKNLFLNGINYGLSVIEEKNNETIS